MNDFDSASIGFGGSGIKCAAKWFAMGILTYCRLRARVGVKGSGRLGTKLNVFFEEKKLNPQDDEHKKKKKKKKKEGGSTLLSCLVWLDLCPGTVSDVALNS
jgi:hypothetical protein